MWLNWYLCQWDLFLESTDISKECITSNKNLLFKKINENSYIYYRHATEMLDAILTDYNHLKYEKRHLIAAIIFLIYCKFYEIPFFSNKKTSSNILDKDYFIDLFNSEKYKIIFKKIFGEFLDLSFNFIFEDIVYACVYCSKYLTFEFSYEYPLIIKAKNEKLENVKKN